jgi:hypothetical protein
MKIIAFDTLKPGFTFDDLKPHLKEEARAAWKNYESGVYRELYIRDDRPGAVIVLECENVDAAKAIMNELPLLKMGFIEFEYIPVKHFFPFSLLFEKS